MMTVTPQHFICVKCCCSSVSSATALSTAVNSTVADARDVPSTSSVTPTSIFAKFSSSANQSYADHNLGEDAVYLSTPPVQTEQPETFWSSQLSDEFPTLRRLATKYLSIPATSASVERLFSTAGAIIRARRNRLSPETVEALLLHMQQ